MRDYLSIGSSPAAESCAQVGSDNYIELSKKECKAFINQIRRIYGNEPTGAKLAVKSFEHEFGTYHEVVCYYNNEIQESVDYAYKCEDGGNENWDEEARKELGLPEAT